MNENFNTVNGFHSLPGRIYFCIAMGVTGRSLKLMCLPNVIIPGMFRS